MPNNYNSNRDLECDNCIVNRDCKLICNYGLYVERSQIVEDNQYLIGQ